MGTNAVVPINNVSRFDDPAIIAAIKQTVAKGASDAQLCMFLQVCKRTGLDPFLKEVWFVPATGAIMAARDGYLRVANEHPEFDGMETRVERDEKNIPVKAVCTVWRKDRGHPIICEAYYNEYVKSSEVWRTYKSAMIGKVAEVLALKRSFAINGTVTEEEIGYATDAPQHGSQAAADAVAEKRIAEEKEKAAHGSNGNGQSPAPEPVPAAVQAIWARMNSIKGVCEQLAELKLSLCEVMGKEQGEWTYYQKLERHGAKHANDFKSTKPARLCARDLFDVIQNEVSIKPAMERVATDDDLPDALWPDEKPAHASPYSERPA